MQKSVSHIFKRDNTEEVYTLAKNAVVLVPKFNVTKVLVQEAANQITSILRSVEIYHTKMAHTASMLPEYPVVMEMYGVDNFFGLQLIE